MWLVYSGGTCPIHFCNVIYLNKQLQNRNNCNCYMLERDLHFQGYDSGNKRRCDILENLVSLGCEYSFIKKPDHEITVNQVTKT